MKKKEKDLVKEASELVDVARASGMEDEQEKRLDVLQDRLTKAQEYLIRVSVDTKIGKKGKEVQRVKEIGKVSVEGEPFKVVGSVGLTINLGNYESARVSAGLEYPTSKEGIPEAFKEVWKIIEQEVSQEVKGIKEKTSVDLKEE